MRDPSESSRDSHAVDEESETAIAGDVRANGDPMASKTPSTPRKESWLSAVEWARGCTSSRRSANHAVSFGDLAAPARQ